MKLIIFGAAGRVGFRLALAALACGHEVTAFVRDRGALAERVEADASAGASRKAASAYAERIERMTVVEGDATDEGAVAAAMPGHGVAVNAAGSPRDVEAFHEVCRNVITQAETYLDADGAGLRRLWLFGGVAALDVPQLGIIGTDCPGVPEVYKVHKKNYELLRAAGQSLDWTMICPGQIVEQIPESGKAVEPDKELVITTDVMPYDVWGWTRFLPRTFHSIIMASRLPKLAVSHDDVARTIMQNLETGGPYSKKRIGLALRAKQAGDVG